MKINNKKGLTLVELVITIALIGLIAVVFMPIFLLSAKTNNQSEDKLNATYIGKDAMEMVYRLSETDKFENVTTNMESEKYIFDSINSIYYKIIDNKRTEIKYDKQVNLIRVLVKVYEDKTNNKLEVQYETLYFWEGKTQNEKQ